MSMITGCPACGTMFKVVPDQLKISDGWVRCGHCSEVFDAAANMVPPAALREAGVATDDESQGEPQRDPPHEPDHQPLLEQEQQPDPAPVVVEQPDPAPHAGPEATHAPFEQPHDPVVDGPLQDGPVAVAGSSPEASPSTAAVQADAAIDGADPIELEDVGFIRKARRRAFWARPAVRALLVLLLLALAALLAGQVAVEERDRLAAMHPEARPWLEKLCEPLGCAIGPPRRIEAIAIDSSTFSKLRTDTYRLSLTLKNQAPQPVAIPAIELTLTDTQDQPVLRRVLQPRELGAASDTIASNGEWAAGAAIAVGGTGSGRIAGYRLLAFYP